MRNTSRAGLAPVIVLAILAAIPAVGFGVLWRWAEARVTDRAATEQVVEPVLPAALTTPVLSVRRAPQVLAGLASDAALITSLSLLVPYIGTSSCLKVEVGGRPVFDQAGMLAVTPASNEKLITGAVALEVLGADSVFTTKLLGTVADGVVTGNLYLLGGGDPLLSTADYPASVTSEPPTNTTSLETLVTNLAAAGVTRIQGDVVGDDSRYDAERFVPSWAADIQNTEAGPLGALMVNDATRELGTFKRYTDPATGAATDLTKLLKNVGITVGGQPTSGATPADTPELASVQSEPLSAIIGEMLTTSDDNTAELLLKEIGLHNDGTVGTRAGGIAAIMNTLAKWGIDTAPLAIVDGSGLDSGNSVTCTALLQVLDHQPLDGPIGKGLAIAGQTGTLTDQFLGTSLVGRLHAKTGTLTNAKALTGFVTTSTGTIEFSLVLDSQGIGASGNPAYSALWLLLSDALGPYPMGPAVDVLQPR